MARRSQGLNGERGYYCNTVAQGGVGHQALRPAPGSQRIRYKRVQIN